MKYDMCFGPLIRNQKHTEIMRFLNMANNVDNYLCKEEY